MTIKFEYTNLLLKKMDRYVFFLCSDVKKDLLRIQKLLNIEKIPKKLIEGFNGKIGDEKILYLDDKEVYFIGYGKNDKCDESTLYHIMGSMGRSFSSNDKNIKKTWIELIGDKEISIKNQIIGFILGIYNFIEYKSNKEDKKKSEEVFYFYHKKKKMKDIIEKTINEGVMQNRVRDLINEPANELNSKKYIQYIKSNLNKKIKCKILSENELKKKGLNLILAVNAGSKNPCYLVILEYTSSKEYEKEKPICLVGKGVMFDSGGLNIKLHDFSDMKEDMAGSAIMYNIINLLAMNQIKGKYMAFLPIVENMVDATSTRPGDIIKSYSGKTVEIIDTDAEGRLILSDAINYTKNYNPKMIIDIATLTGGVSSILGNKGSVVVGTKNSSINKIKEIGKNIHENMWDLPMWEEYVDLTKSNVADIKNYSSDARASTVMAAAFLYNFLPETKEKIDWIHIDNASVDFLSGGTSTRCAGGTGEGFRTIYNYIVDNSKK
jgi:leucyl aminopeptidase